MYNCQLCGLPTQVKPALHRIVYRTVTNSHRTRISQGTYDVYEEQQKESREIAADYLVCPSCFHHSSVGEPLGPSPKESGPLSPILKSRKAKLAPFNLKT